MSKSYNAMICLECGCEDFRFDEVMGKYCNNCGLYTPYCYDKYEPNFTVDYLRNKYKEGINNV